MVNWFICKLSVTHIYSCANIKQSLNFECFTTLHKYIYFQQVFGVFIFIRLCAILKRTSTPGPPDVNKWIIGNDIHGLSAGRVVTHGPGRGYVNEHARTWVVSIWCSTPRYLCTVRDQLFTVLSAYANVAISVRQGRNYVDLAMIAERCADMLCNVVGSMSEASDTYSLGIAKQTFVCVDGCVGCGWIDVSDHRSPQTDGSILKKAWPKFGCKILT